MDTEKRRAFPLFCAFLVYTIFGFSFLFSKVALAVATPIVLLATRFLIAFLVLNLMLLSGKFKLDLKGKNVKLLLLLGLLTPIIYFLCENYGINLLATSLVGILLALIPAACTLFGSLLLGEKAGAKRIICVLVSAFGVFLTTFGQEVGAFNWLGFILILGAVCSTALFSVFSRKISLEFTPFERTYVMFALGSVTFAVIALIQCRGNMREMVFVPYSHPSFWISIAFLAVLSSVCAFFMLNYAVSHLDVASTAIFANVSTIISIFAGVFVLKESFGVYQIIGSVIILLSVYLINRPVKQVPEESA